MSGPVFVPLVPAVVVMTGGGPVDTPELLLSVEPGGFVAGGWVAGGWVAGGWVSTGTVAGGLVIIGVSDAGAVVWVGGTVVITGGSVVVAGGAVVIGSSLHRFT